MAHGEASRPLEAKDGSPVDVRDSALSTHDSKVLSLLEEMNESLKKLVILMEIQTDVELEP